MPAYKMPALGPSTWRVRHLMTCAMCNQQIGPDEVVNQHHGPVYRSEGGTATEPVHQSCHVKFHSLAGDFRYYGSIGGKLSALTKRWAYNLKNVNTHPAHEINRAYYAAHYAH